MRKTLLLVIILVVALVVAAPATAQVGQEFEQGTESGDVDQSFVVTGSGSAANQCAAILAAAQTGSLQNTSGSVQSNSAIEEVEQEGSGSNLALSPELAEECEQTINQAAAASAAKTEPKAAPTPALKTAAKSETPQAKTASSTKAESKKAEEKKELPKTGGLSGGNASLFALGAGTLLVAGGLLARGIVK